jgi:hypothetical protein
MALRDTLSHLDIGQAVGTNGIYCRGEILMVGAACSTDRCAAPPLNAPRRRASSLGYAWRNRATASACDKILSPYRTISNSITRCRAKNEYG